MLLAALLTVLATPAAAQTLPACQGPTAHLASRAAFHLCFDSSRHTPLWTLYQLTPDRLTPRFKRLSHFRPDPQFLSPSNADYRASGFARGHLVPARDMSWSQDALRDSFLLSNAAPQLPSLNSGIWLRIENAVRSLAAHADSVWVVTGTLFESPAPEHIGSNHVAVPTHFFKAVLAIHEDRKVMYAAIVPNQAATSRSLRDFAASVDEIERRASLDLFAFLNDEEEQILESAREIIPSRQIGR